MSLAPNDIDSAPCAQIPFSLWSERKVQNSVIMIGVTRLNWDCKLQVITRSAHGNIYRCVTTEYYNNGTRVQQNNKALCECGSKWWIIMHIGNDYKVIMIKYAYVNDGTHYTVSLS